MARPTASELRAIAAAKKNATDLADDILDEAKKIAVKGENSLDLSADARYTKLSQVEREALHAELVALGFAVEENRKHARYFWELRW